MKFLAIAKQTVFAYARDRIFHSVLVFSILLILFSFALSTMTIVESRKILLDFGLSAVSIMGILLSLFLGVTLVGWEVERRTIYTVLSKPIRRWEYLLGKYLGGALVVALVHVFSFFVLKWVVWRAGDELPSGMPQALLLMTLESMIVMALAMLLSLVLSSLFLVASISGAIFLVGRSASTFRTLYEKAEEGSFKVLLRVLYDITPSLERFNIREVVAYGKPYPDDMVSQGLLYFFLYTLFLLGTSFTVFRKKDLR